MDMHTFLFWTMDSSTLPITAEANRVMVKGGGYNGHCKGASGNGLLTAPPPPPPLPPPSPPVKPRLLPPPLLSMRQTEDNG